MSQKKIEKIKPYHFECNRYHDKLTSSMIRGDGLGVVIASYFFKICLYSK